MLEFYEKHRDEGDIIIGKNSGLIFPPHFHRNIEILLLRSGEYEITVSGEKYTVDSGSILIVDSYEIHSYDKCLREDISPDNCFIILPSAYTEGFNFSRKEKKFSKSVIKDKELCDELFSFTEKYLEKGGEVTRRASELFLAILSERIGLCEAKSGTDGKLVRQILMYIESNYRGDISRTEIARALGYTEAHISRVFHSFIGKGISEYINNLRLSYIDSLVSSGDTRSRTELMTEAGFKSQQTYYRVKKRAKK